MKLRSSNSKEHDGTGGAELTMKANKMQRYRVNDRKDQGRHKDYKVKYCDRKKGREKHKETGTYKEPNIKNVFGVV